MNTAILLVSCPDRRGLVADVTEFIHRNNGNILDLEQHVDREEGVFFMRVEWDLQGFAIPPEKIEEYFHTLIGQRNAMRVNLHLEPAVKRMAVFASHLPHCLYDLLSRAKSGEWAVDVPLIISNHEKLRHIADQFEIPFHALPVTPETKAKQEARALELMGQAGIDLVVLARYMQVVTPAFLEAYPNRVINIHHSFLPAFPGAKPYHSAYERGVKVIGATSHYVTPDLDQGPIIAQGVTPVTHRDSVEDMKRKGLDLEKTVLAQAVWAHLRHRTIVYRNRTVVFG